jgi:hypothetical protein
MTLLNYTGETQEMPTVALAAVTQLVMDKALACALAEHNAQAAAQEMVAGLPDPEAYARALCEYEGFSREAQVLWTQVERISREESRGELMIWAYMEVAKETPAAGEGRDSS